MNGGSRQKTEAAGSKAEWQKGTTEDDGCRVLGNDGGWRGTDDDESSREPRTDNHLFCRSWMPPDCLWSGIPEPVHLLKVVPVTATEPHHRPPDVNPIRPEDGFLAVLLAEANSLI